MPRPAKAAVSDQMLLDNNNFGGNSKPKGKLSAYGFFVQICREEHRSKHPDEPVAFGDFSKKCSERWKGMTDGEKVQFNQMAEVDKRRFEAEMQTYSKSDHHDVQPAAVSGGRGRGRGRKKKDPNAPKRSM